MGTCLERAAAWTDPEVARRWLALFPGPGGKRDRPSEESAIQSLCQESGKLTVCRNRLADVSWFMRCLELLDWTGRALRADKRGHLSPHLRPVLQRLDLEVDAWAENVAHYGSLFHRIADKIHRLRAWVRSRCELQKWVSAIYLLFSSVLAPLGTLRVRLDKVSQSHYL